MPTEIGKRKIIRLTVAGTENTHVTQTSVVLYALCDDGSVWLSRGLGGEWERMNDIPQEFPPTDAQQHEPWCDQGCDCGAAQISKESN